MSLHPISDLIVHDHDATAISWRGGFPAHPSRRSLVDKTAKPVMSPPSIVAGDLSLTWSALRDRLHATPYARGQRIGLQPTADVDSIVAILSIIDRGALPVLAHHRWPAPMVADAFAIAGVGKVWPSTWAPSTVMFTSGSTGRPKAVVHDVTAHVDNARGALSVMPFGVGCRWLLSLPLGHVGGLAVLFRALVGGGAVVVPPCPLLRDSIIATQPTHLSMVAAQLQQLVDDAEALAVLQQHAQEILVGGGPTSAALLARAVALGLPVRQTWGLTEMGSQVCTSPRGLVTTCGPALPGRFVRARDDGELVVGGAGRFSGFLHDEALLTPFDDDGGYATGDLGVIVDGDVVITGRKGNRFISGGENIQPETIEQALSGGDVVVVVVPVDDARFGKRPFAFFNAGPHLGTDGDVTALLRARAVEALPRYMHPVDYAPLPDQGGLKPRRHDLATIAWRHLHHGALS